MNSKEFNASVDLLYMAALRKDAKGISPERHHKICEAERDGRCVVLPPDGQIYHIEQCEERWVGNKPYKYITKDGYHCGWGLVAILFPFSELGKTVFLTRAEAEAALKKGDAE